MALMTDDDENKVFMWIKVKTNTFSGSTCISIAAEKVSPPLNEGSDVQAIAKTLIYLERCQHKVWD